MKRVFLILLALFLPLQTTVAAEQGFAHALGQGSGDTYALKHFVEHEEQVAHHHDDDGDEHDDDSLASAQHLIDHAQSCGMSFIVSTPVQITFVVASQVRPISRADVVATRSTSPPQRPPHAPA